MGALMKTFRFRFRTTPLGVGRNCAYQHADIRVAAARQPPTAASLTPLRIVIAHRHWPWLNMWRLFSLRIAGAAHDITL